MYPTPDETAFWTTEREQQKCLILAKQDKPCNYSTSGKLN